MSFNIKQGSEAEEGHGALVQREESRSGENVPDEAVPIFPLLLTRLLAI